MHRIAEIRGLLVYELEEILTYTELLDWIEYFDWKLSQHDKSDYYLAQIAGMLSGKKSARINDFLISFRKNERFSEDERMEKSKLYWTVITGVTPKHG